MEGFFFLPYNTKYISQTLGFCDQVPEKSNLREERFILLTVSDHLVGTVLQSEKFTLWTRSREQEEKAHGKM
jgi:hypothetical protein